MNKLLDIKDLSINFRIKNEELRVVDKANLFVLEGETLVLAGESGSGKTILSLAITKILPEGAYVSGGDIYFENKKVLRFNEKDLSDLRGRKIAYIFQEPTSYLNPVYTIGNQITEAILLHQRTSRKKAESETLDLLRMVRISEPKRVFFSYPHQLSGGMNQRAFIAMALASKPSLLIADEPTTSLDVSTESQILELLAELKTKIGFSTLFITHNLSVAKKIADRVSIMYRGSIVETSNIKEIFSSPVQTHTRELLYAYEKIGKI